MNELVDRTGQLERAVVNFSDNYAIPMLRVSLGLTYIWFGLLKVIGKSPVGDLVAKTVFILPRKIVVPVLGLWETAIGLGFLFRFPIRLTLVAFYGQLAGTFLVLIVRPRDAFQNGNPLLLSKNGEFVIKNLILAAAGLAVGSRMNRPTERVSGPPSS